MHRIAIIGGGFAGLAAARTLTRRAGTDLDVHLFDVKKESDFLPLLPDLLGGGLTKAVISQSLQQVADDRGFTFHHTRVSSVDPESGAISTAEAPRESHAFDYLIVATGAESNYYDYREAARISFPLRSAAHVENLLVAVEERRAATLVIVGGGYTGIEAASQLRRRSDRQGLNLKIIILEMKDSILPGNAPWMQQYMSTQLASQEIEIRINCRIEEFTDGGVRLSDGDTIEACLVVWNAGVKAVNPLSTPDANSKPAAVDTSLRISPVCYVIGDAARIEHEGRPLPMASYLAIEQGARAAGNILRSIAGRTPKPYRPRYLGFVIPLANGRGCGRILGVKIKGRSAPLVHYVASFFRLRNGASRRLFIRQLLGRDREN